MKTLEEWTVEDVGNWLCAIRMEAYHRSFRFHEIDGKTLRDLTIEELKEEMGISKLGHRKQVIRERDSLVEPAAAPARSTAGLDLATSPRASASFPPQDPRFLANLKGALDTGDLVFNFGDFPSGEIGGTIGSGTLPHLRPVKDERNSAVSIGHAPNGPGIPTSLKAVQGTASVAPFAELPPRTNLNNPSPNWLKRDPRIQTADIDRSFPDLAVRAVQIPEVQFVGNSDDIKALLKAPFAKESVSLMVHRVGDTLMVNEPKLSDFRVDTKAADWTVQAAAGKPSHGSQAAQKKRSTYSKFLYHTLHAAAAANPPKEERKEKEANGTGLEEEGVRPLAEKVTVPPQPQQQPDHFKRIVHWGVGDASILVGSDAAVFGTTLLFHPARRHRCL